jgi:beta-lactamase class D
MMRFDWRLAENRAIINQEEYEGWDMTGKTGRRSTSRSARDD